MFPIIPDDLATKGAYWVCMRWSPAVMETFKPVKPMIGKCTACESLVIHSPTKPEGPRLICNECSVDLPEGKVCVVTQATADEYRRLVKKGMH